MNIKDRAIVTELKNQLILEFQTDVDKIILFGSRAYGKPHKNSDYDILLILNKDNYDWKYKTRIIDKIYDLELEKDIVFDVHIISNYELKQTLRGIQPIFKNAIQKGIYL